MRNADSRGPDGVKFINDNGRATYEVTLTNRSWNELLAQANTSGTGANKDVWERVQKHFERSIRFSAAVASLIA